MPEINVTQAVMDLLEASSLGLGRVFKPKGKKLDNGMWRIPLQEDTYKRLKARKFPGESFSDSIERMFGAARGN